MPNSPSVVGIQQIEAAYIGVFQEVDLKIKYDIVEIEVMSRDWAFVRSNSAGTVAINATGEKYPGGNQELFVLHKTDDVDWKIARYSFSTTDPYEGD